ncbi:uncharacterized protein K452DRAFT_289982 [Aplosporella prunicola CBS 121167]|uniref:Pre-mRNA-splicing factor SYF2 n=1 Tax=Aplosporella prunicola CBS 121167 TaxID=1176127 RepID=A0A6A6B5K4_9PEZI|nr:uncharacterized protein K452DRAFT_289982 [Aplosporella prunicola CBS 121167]KAF2139422.1 hypothetical protein K452DRAFT_289982 [Aplosporella prunicola CBS 121167]
MSTAQKRKTSLSGGALEEESAKRRFVETESAPPPEDVAPDAAAEDAASATDANTTTTANDTSSTTTTTTTTTTTAPAASSSSSSAANRLSRFKALQARQAASRTQNLKDSSAEAARASIDPSALTAAQRKHAIATHKLLKAEAADAGEDFERKRAWDWTVEESERWDKRVAKKEKHRQDVAFADYRQDARKVYKRQLRELAPDTAGYERAKAEAVRRAAASGGLDIVEGADGELIAVDRDGSFYSTADSTDFASHRPDKEGVDKLVGEIRKAEEARLKARRARGIDDEAGDITYINQKNKQFNEKLARFYNKYTGDIRESFERGTAL